MKRFIFNVSSFSFDFSRDIINFKFSTLRNEINILIFIEQKILYVVSNDSLSLSLSPLILPCFHSNIIQLNLNFVTKFVRFVQFQLSLTVSTYFAICWVFAASCLLCYLYDVCILMIICTVCYVLYYR